MATWWLLMDFRAVYDRTYRSMVFEAMIEANISSKLIALTKMTLRHSSCKIRENGKFLSPCK